MDLLYPWLLLVSLLLASCCVISHPVQPTTQQDTSVRNLSFGAPQLPTQGGGTNKARYFLPYTSDKRNPIYSFGLGKRYLLNDYLTQLYDNQALKRSPAGQPRFGFGLGKRNGAPATSEGSAELNDDSEYADFEPENEKRAFEVSDNLDWATDDIEDDEHADELKYVWNFANSEEKRKIAPLRGYYVIHDYPNLVAGQPRRNLEFKKRAKQHRVSPLGKRLPVYDFGLGKRNSGAMF